MIYLFLAPGFEETEAIATVDVLRRAALGVTVVSIGHTLDVESAHKVIVRADALFSEISFDDARVLILPGGMPGTLNLLACKPLCEVLYRHYQKGGLVAAICAAPLIFGRMGMLQGKEAVCYPGFENELSGAQLSHEGVVVSGNVITGKSVAFALPFGVEIVATLLGREKADEVKAAMVLDIPK